MAHLSPHLAPSTECHSSHGSRCVNSNVKWLDDIRINSKTIAHTTEVDNLMHWNSEYYVSLYRAPTWSHREE